MTHLSAATLSSLPSTVSVPAYDRSGLSVGIVHFGVGGFHRAHQAMYVDRLLNSGQARDWAVLGVGVLPHDAAMKRVLDSQDCLYTLVAKAPDGSEDARVIGSIVEYLFAPEDPEAVIEAIAAPGVRIVSMTITEGGYCIDPVTGEVDAGHPALRADLAPGAIPATDQDRARVAEGFGVEDGWPVVCEDFEQWVLEDDFAQGRPAWEDAGVQLVDDVEPYELMKLRLLNVSHQALCYPGYLAGYRLVHDVCQDPAFARYLLAYMEQEATPTLRPVPGVDLDAYRRQLISRFSNAAVRDTVPRLCAESFDRIPKWLVPLIRENLEAGRSVRYGAAIIAAWARYAEGTDEAGEPIEIVDRLHDQVREAASRSRTDPLAFLRQQDLFLDLAEQPAFVEAYLEALGTLHTQGAAALVARLAG
ncbi:mannitol dehydrogenase family protein [Arthrobacter sp. MDT1-65]